MNQARTRLLAGAQGVQAILLLCQPERLLRPIVGSAGTVRPGIVRLLGGRLLLQAIWLSVRPTRTVRRLSAAIDLLHAASMLGLAVGAARYRRPAMVSGLIAAGSAGLTLELDRR